MTAKAINDSWKSMLERLLVGGTHCAACGRPWAAMLMAAPRFITAETADSGTMSWYAVCTTCWDASDQTTRVRAHRLAAFLWGWDWKAVRRALNQTMVDELEAQLIEAAAAIDRIGARMDILNPWPPGVAVIQADDDRSTVIRMPLITDDAILRFAGADEDTRENPVYDPKGWIEL